uniref:Uncharacterized protein n=1 Tax=Salix viminalis TaxID=40686 RepID=A0A6N2L975_SALVM
MQKEVALESVSTRGNLLLKANGQNHNQNLLLKGVSPCIMQTSPSGSHLVIIIIGPYPFKFVSHGNNGGRMNYSASFLLVLVDSHLSVF